jgi:hypothetical protein
MAKTVMGYSAQEMIAQMRQQGVPPGTPGASPQPQVSQPPMAQAPGAVGHQAPALQPTMQQRPQSGMPNPPSAHNPATAAQMAKTIAPSADMLAAIGPPPGMNAMNPQMAATMAPQPMNPQMAATIAPSQMSPFAPPSGNPGAILGGPSMGGPMAGPGHGPGPGPGPSIGAPVLGGGGVLTGSQPAVSAAVTRPTPAISAQPAAAARRPMAPTTDVGDALARPVKLAMLVLGLLLIVQFVVPLSLDPLAFAFQGVGDLPVKALLPLVSVPAIGVLALVLSFVPMATPLRSALALVLGLAGIGIAFQANGLFDNIVWQLFAVTVSTMLAVAGLAIRGHYPDSMAARILVTIGVVALLAAVLVPDHDSIMLVEAFKSITAGGKDTAGGLAVVIGVLTTLLALTAWRPGPGSGGATFIALLVLVCTFTTVNSASSGLFVHFVDVFVVFDIGAAVKQPALGLLGWVPVTAFLGLVGWGLGGVVGRPA